MKKERSRRGYEPEFKREDILNGSGRRIEPVRAHQQQLQRRIVERNQVQSGITLGREQLYFRADRGGWAKAETRERHAHDQVERVTTTSIKPSDDAFLFQIPSGDLTRVDAGRLFGDMLIVLMIHNAEGCRKVVNIACLFTPLPPRTFSSFSYRCHEVFRTHFDSHTWNIQG